MADSDGPENLATLAAPQVEYKFKRRDKQRRDRHRAVCLVPLIKRLDDDRALLAVDILLAKGEHFGDPSADISERLAEGALSRRQVLCKCPGYNL
ncbi:MAG: hypothetical protein WBX25_05060 [Rhodomicrobium sp.]